MRLSEQLTLVFAGGVMSFVAIELVRVFLASFVGNLLASGVVILISLYFLVKEGYDVYGATSVGALIVAIATLGFDIWLNLIG